MKKDESQLNDIVFEDSDEEGLAKGAADKVKKLKEKLAVVEKERQEYLDGWQRARADYANLQKSQEEDRKRLRSIIEEDFMHELLPVIDSFNQAFGNKEAWEKVDPNWRKGVEYIYLQLMTTLENHSLQMFGEVGEAFDPVRHQAVSETPTEDDALDHTVAAVLQKGFLHGNTVLRAARVSVYKRNA